MHRKLGSADSVVNWLSPGKPELHKGEIPLGQYSCKKFLKKYKKKRVKRSTDYSLTAQCVTGDHAVRAENLVHHYPQTFHFNPQLVSELVEVLSPVHQKGLNQG